MLVGFGLFRRLRREWDCVEVFPQAIAAVVGAARVHKRHAEGTLCQLTAAANYTGWPSTPSVSSLDGIAYGNRHDRLDAYLAAWVAPLPEARRVPLGCPPDDAIWVPRLTPEDDAEYALGSVPH
jgi:hypothetical protein